MEANICDINHLDSDVLLPPRKRLLAVLKKQNSDGNSHTTTSTSSGSSSSEFDTRLNNVLRSHLVDPNLLPDEIVEASRSAAEAAVKVAEAARAVAEEKAAVAAKAVAAAKSALDMVATFSKDTTCKERYSKKKNKLKKHVEVEMLYNNKKNGNTDEEVARNLHRVINSSPRITKNSSSSDLKSHKHKRVKTSASEKTRVSNGFIVWEEKNPLKSNGNGIAGKVDSESSLVRIEESTSRFNKDDRNGEHLTIHSTKKIGEALEDTSSIGRKRGRIKQKKLPLSICNFRDQSNPKEESKSRNLLREEEVKSRRLLTEEKISNNKSSISVEPSGDSVMPVERTSSMWKCQQAFKAPPACVKQNKVLQS